MDPITGILQTAVEQKGFLYLLRRPLEVYHLLTDAGIDGPVARCVVSTLLAGLPDSSDTQAQTIQAQCLLQPEIAQRLACVYSELGTLAENDPASWARMPEPGFRAFCDSVWESSISFEHTWQGGAGSIDCEGSCVIAWQVDDEGVRTAYASVCDQLAEDPGLTEAALFEHFHALLAHDLSRAFASAIEEHWANSADTLPAPEDFDCKYYAEKCCASLGLKVLRCQYEGDAAEPETDENYW